MSENSELEAEGTAPEQTPDYESETIEQLEERFRKGEGIIRDDVEADPEPEPEAEPEVEPEAAEEAEPETETEEEPELAAAEETEEEFDERQSMIDELKLQLEKERINAQKLQHLQSRDAGMVGYLKKEMEALKQAVTQPAPTDEYEYAAEPTGQPRAVSAPGNDALQSRLAELESSARAGAIEAEYTSFLSARGLEGDKASEFLKSMGPAIAEQWEPYREQVDSMSASSLRKSLRFVLDSAYADLRLSELQAQRESALAKRASQVPERKKAKLASATAGSGSVASAPKGPTSPSEMTAEEADAELLRLHGTQARSGRIRTL